MILVVGAAIHSKPRSPKRRLTRMCSFLFTRTALAPSPSLLADANRLARHRGPDATRIAEAVAPDGYHLRFLHNLLDISGHARVQPLCEGAGGRRLWVLFNGEIYNYGAFTDGTSDTECLLPAYRSLGRGMARALDGEFAFVIYDESANRLLVGTDPFLTKPLYFGRGPSPGDFGVATCASTLRGLGFAEVGMAEPNASWEVAFAGADVHIDYEFPVFPFDLRQHKRNFDDWNAAFFEAVRKRATHGARRPAVFLSSGYDSGGICLALNALGLPYETLSFRAGENEAILDERIRINRAASCRRAFRYRGLPPRRWAASEEDILRNVEPFPYVHEDGPGQIGNVHTDSGAVGGNFIARQARRKGCLVNLSGSGADEILSDYGFRGKKHYHHSEFGGLFPDDLESIFPWRKFYGDTQRSYLFKEEFILGRHGVEGRYPFLDRALVQEFLWLAADLKNEAYKAPLAALLTAHGYPFEPDAKRGFHPHVPTGLARAALGKARRLAGRFFPSIARG